MNRSDIPWLFDPANWQIGPSGAFPALIAVHLGYTFSAVAIAALIALPVGLWIGHTGRFSFIVIAIGNAGRSLPTFGLISLLVVTIGLGITPMMVALVVLAIPPILTSTFAGLRAVNRHTVDAAHGMGMRDLQMLWRVEIPNSLPLIFAGIRSATLQVIATATVAAYVGLGGLGQPLITGLSLNQYDRVIAGGVLVALLAILIDLALAGLERLVVSPGITNSLLRPTRRRTPRAPARATSSPLGRDAIAADLPERHLP
ncbi:ABC transporter permease [Rathayibacter sp. VKM Ac-2754]|uniref:ABC transporter permease n=1 Tax=Rathayibacter sp. VKM Ac-2754 TaxID=2609251 RepID=UPI00135AB137|nr:ABC transporter permease [Rathayibacter sp. VKM Ac-2754]MWV60095.1 ABC transporter permease subunit [Rathayibacter sp. VKM Ac-2754]